MDLISKIYQNLGIDERKDPFKKTASKKSPLSHFGIRNDLDYDYQGENVKKKPEVTATDSNWVQSAFEKLQRIGLEQGYRKFLPSIQKGTISGKPVLVVTFPGGEEWAPFDEAEVDQFINSFNSTVQSKKQAILDVLEAPNMYEHLPNRWKVIASITGIEDPEAAFSMSYDGYCNLSDSDRITLAHSNDYDSKISAWYDSLMGKQASDDMSKEEAYDKLFQMLSRDTQMRIKWEVSDPLPKENNTAEQKYVLDKVVEIGTPDEQHLVEIYREKYAVKKVAQANQCHCIFHHAITSQERDQAKHALERARELGDTTGIQVALQALQPCPSVKTAQGINPQEQYPFPGEGGNPPEEQEEGETKLFVGIDNLEDLEEIINSRLGWAIAEQFKSIVDGESFEEQNSNALRYIAEFLQSRKETGAQEASQQIMKYLSHTEASKRKADSGPNEFGTKTTDSYTETRHEDHDGKDMNQNYPHGSPIDNNKSVIDDMLTSDPTPTVYAPSESDGILFDTIERANPQRDMPLDQDKKEFEGVNAQKKQIIASMQKSGQQWQYFLNSLNKVKELDGKFITRPLLDSGFYPILRDMEDKGFVEFKKVKITGTAPKIIMTDKGKLALTAVEEKMGQEKKHEPATVSPAAAPADLPGTEAPAASVDQLGSETPGISPDNDPNAETEVALPALKPKKTKITKLPKREPIPAMKTYSVSDVEKFAPHIANAMVKSGILFTEKESFDKRYASYINQVKAMPRINQARLEKKAAELEIAVPIYRKLLLAQEGIKVLSHDEFSKQANVPKPKLYQYKDAGTYVKIGNEEYVVASLTEDQIFLKKAQAGYDTEKEIEESGVSTPLNQYLDNKDMKFMVYEKKEDKKGKLLGYGHSHKRARMFGLANGEGNYIVEVINEKVGPTSSNTGSPEIYGVYEFEVRKMPSGGSHPTDGDSLKVMNYCQKLDGDPATHVTKLVQEASKRKAQTRKMYVIYPKGIEGQDEMYDWLFDAADKMNFDFDEDSITMDSAKVWGRNIPDEQLEQRFKKSGVDYTYDETPMPEMNEPTGPRQRGPKLEEEPIQYDQEQEGEGMETHARLTKRGETALKALFKSFERVIRDVTISGKTFEDANDRKFMLNLMSFVENNLESLAKVAGVSEQEESQMEQEIEQAEEVLESPENHEAPESPKVQSPVVEEPKASVPVEELHSNI